MEFVKGHKKEAKELFEIIKDRIIWMDENGIDQWNNHDYLHYYPLSYFYEMAQKGRLYVLIIDMKVVGGCILLDKDKLWYDSKGNSLYIHNLATKIEYKGAGRIIIENIINLAKEKGKKYIRIDCDESNTKLNEYYDSFGFVNKETFSLGVYNGIKKELIL